MQMVMQRGFTWRGSHDNLFGFAKSVTAGRLAKESWLQRLHVKPSIARIQIEFLCNINEFIYCNTLHFFLAKNRDTRTRNINIRIKKVQGTCFDSLEPNALISISIKSSVVDDKLGLLHTLMNSSSICLHHYLSLPL
ncbi:hypothetical protein Geoth_1105 [Parageobacillus thermoglucosidasius C56-YS93]|nr:hypothetical protein Geoth_1105 [Parageobacillus thermoglucosidasius C56-YS93]